MSNIKISDVEWLNNFLYGIIGVTIIFLLGLFLVFAIIRNDINLILVSYPVLLFLLIMTRINYKKWQRKINDLKS